MKKLMSSLLLLVLAVGGYFSWNYYHDTYVGDTYFTVIPSGIELETVKNQTGDVFGPGYIYDLIAYDQKGRPKEISFDVITEGPYKSGTVYEAGTYVQVKASKNRVLSKKAVSASQVPDHVLELLNNNG